MYALALGFILSLAIWTTSPSATLAQQGVTPPPDVSPLSPHALSPIVETQGALHQTAAASGVTHAWIYLAACGLSLVLGGLYLIRRARANQRVRQVAEEPETQLVHTVKRARAASQPASSMSEMHALARSIAQSTTAELGALAVESEMGSPIIALRSDGPQRECPKCSRKFASWMAICPFDATTLRDPVQPITQVRKRAMRLARGAKDEVLSRKRCVVCERRYHRSLDHCPHDGERLLPDHREDALEAESWHLCRACGEDKPVKDGALECGCGEDERDHTVLNHARLSATGMVFQTCPVCHTYARPGETHCAEHGELFVPEDMITRNALPLKGYGPLRKVCTTCGERYSGAYIYCPRDSTRLKHID